MPLWGQPPSAVCPRFMDLFAHACVREFRRLTSHFGSKSVSSLVKNRADEIELEMHRQFRFRGISQCAI